jgi:glutaredoxin
MSRTILYTRHSCCLCDQAKAQLQAHGLTVEEIDIDGDPALREKYNDWVPVVEIDGRERFRGRVDEMLLRRLLGKA